MPEGTVCPHELNSNGDPVCWVTIPHPDEPGVTTIAGSGWKPPAGRPSSSVSVPVKWCRECRGWFRP